MTTDKFVVPHYVQADGPDGLYDAHAGYVIIASVVLDHVRYQYASKNVYKDKREAEWAATLPGINDDDWSHFSTSHVQQDLPTRSVALSSSSKGE